MLSYQHTFHAGNHADVMKHLTLCALIRALSKKAKPFFYLDTHAGNGCYELEGLAHHDAVAALQLLSKTDTQPPSVVDDYMAVVTPYLEKSMYPGSPLLVSELLALINVEKEQRGEGVCQANLQLCELHPSAFEQVKLWMKQTDFHCHHQNGLHLLNAIAVPKPNRGLVFIDPPYEQVAEYEQVTEAVSKAIKKWQNGIFCIWYPLLSPERIDRVSGDITSSPKHGMSEGMLRHFTEFAKQKNIGLLDLQFANQAPSHDVGMYGSGMVIFNPPWQLEDTLSAVLAYLQSHLQHDNNRLSHISMLAPSP